MDDLFTPFLLTLVVFVAAMQVGKVLRRRRFRDKMVDAKTVRHRLDRGEDMLVLDVRTPQEFQRDGHIRGAVNVPLSELSQRLSSAADSLDQYRETPVVLVCRSDNRAVAAYGPVTKHLQNVSILAGGMSGWNGLGMPMVRRG